MAKPSPRYDGLRAMREARFKEEQDRQAKEKAGKSKAKTAAKPKAKAVG